MKALNTLARIAKQTLQIGNKGMELFMRFSIRQFKSNIDQSPCNQGQRSSNKQFHIKISKIKNHRLILLRNLIAVYIKTIPIMLSKINNTILTNRLVLAKNGAPKESPNQPAARLMHKSAKLVRIILSIAISYHKGKENYSKILVTGLFLFGFLFVMPKAAHAANLYWVGSNGAIFDPDYTMMPIKKPESSIQLQR